MLHWEAPYQKNRTESDGYGKSDYVTRIIENNVKHAIKGVKARNRRGTEPYARWCGRSGSESIATFLPDLLCLLILYLIERLLNHFHTFFYFFGGGI